ncbi:Riboflavin transport system permease protein RibX [Peribacillus sp. Bi96]|uniref:ABC transporter permease n=1 Tax=Peribacillus sp. Bi96 TaxID=2884273 RepID=UPI001D1BC2EF|nr:ABC transporter permease [Peribacillus sp. Bi96]CAH0126946.1 Riboflavin transport system permease protein RibX [Peribacillus sp. Bi96]
MIGRIIWKKGAPFFLLLLLLIVWESVTVLLKVEEWLLPAPSAILTEGIESFHNLSGHLISTTELALTGFFIGSCIGLLIAAILHLFPSVKEAVYPLLILSQNIPIIVLAPLLVIWFGFGMLPKLIVISLVCFFPVAVASLDGFRQTPYELKHYFKMMGAGRNQLFWKLELPHSIPFIFSGLKISATYSVMGAVISEWLGAKSGIGVYMTLASSAFRTDRVFVSIFLIMGMSLLFFGIINLLEKYFVSWKRKEGEKDEAGN